MGNQTSPQNNGKGNDSKKDNAVSSESSNIAIKTNKKTKWTSFTHNIPQKKLQKFKTCAVGTYFDSKRFKSEHDMKWCLLIYPNGHNKKAEGYCNVCLYLLSMPKEYGSVFVYYMLSCEQTHAAHQLITRYDKCEGTGWSDGVQSLSELYYLDDISFSTKFRILRIDDHSGHTVYEYPLNTSNLWKQESFQWNIDRELLQKMKTASFGKRFCPLDVVSDSGMYSLFLFPNGKIGSFNWIEGKVAIGLDICALPNGVHAMKLKRKIEILELKKEKSWTTTRSYDYPGDGGIVCDKKDLESLETMTIEVTVDILECHSDLNGTVIPNPIFKTFHAQKHANNDDEKQLESEQEDNPDEDALREYNIRKGRALVAIICVKEYESKEMDDLDAAMVDRQNLKDLFEGDFEYETRILDKDRVTLKDFNKFIFSVRNDLFMNADDYDAFILSFTGHGYRDSICLSDSKNFDRITLYKWFNGENCMPFKDKPKLFLLQACKGLQDAPNVKEQGLVAAPGIGMNDEDLPLGPDDNIVIFESNSDGYVSWLNGDGGFMVQSFVKVMKRNKQRIALDHMSKMMEKEVKRLNQQMACVETLVCKQYGVKDIIYFCKSDE